MINVVYKKMNMNSNKLSLHYIMMHVMFQAMASIIYGFGVYMLVNRGFSNSVAGLCIGLVNGFSIIVQSLLANYLDNTKKINSFQASIFVSLLVVILFLINYSLNNASLFLAIVFVVGCGLYSVLEPVINSMSNIFVKGGYKIDFGVARACGSISYGVLCVLLGILSEKYNVKVILLFGFIISILLSLICVVMNNDYNKSNIVNNNDDAKGENISYLEFIKNNKLYMLICICLTGCLFGYLFIDNFSLLVLERIGGSSKDMGIVLGFKATIEGISMAQYSRYRKFISLNNILRISVFSLSLKILLTYFAPNVTAMYLVQILQGLGFGLIVPASVELVNSYMDKNELQRGHSSFTLAIMIAGLLSSAIGGLVIDKYGVAYMEKIAFIVSVISAIMYSLLIDKVK